MLKTCNESNSIFRRPYHPSNFFNKNLRKYFPDPTVFAKPTWGIIEHFWNFDLSYTDDLQHQYHISHLSNPIYLIIHFHPVTRMSPFLNFYNFFIFFKYPDIFIHIIQSLHCLCNILLCNYIFLHCLLFWLQWIDYEKGGFR